MEFPLSRVPLRGQAGAGGFPPRRKHAARQQKALARIAAPAPPARGVSKRSAETPLAPSPWLTSPMRSPRESYKHGDGGRKRIKDGRHVGLDFYDLLIEPILVLNVSSI